ncbi:MAG: 2-C-methyl-D-erythritol 2,4-cyclodiphosphate synthase, partial [Oscillospiraceae bacterium]|nr:2-C-methyl-D-erythritol 2,4-cyclodiphosphate synthase [Oscillospiraceae bacterium]
VGGMPVLARTLMAFDAAVSVDELVVVAQPEDFEIFGGLLDRYRITKPVRFAAGGSIRRQSVANGIAVAAGADYYAIHDGARPLISPALIDQTVAAALACGCAAPAVPVKDTLKTVNSDGMVTGTPDRGAFLAVQTPQVLSREIYEAACRRVGEADLTDDCRLAELAGYPVRLIPGSEQNIKITTPEDILLAEAFLGKEAGAMRIGHGYDVHRLCAGRKLILGGVEIPFEKGLLGHSDADVLAHAVIDALLGAAGLGDIGVLFPAADPAYAGADSLLLMRQAMTQVTRAGWQPVNIDATVIAQAPKLAPHIPLMRQQIAAACGIPPDAVNVKATTEEGLGFTGQGEGIAAHTIAMLSQLKIDN